MGIKDMANEKIAQTLLVQAANHAKSSLHHFGQNVGKIDVTRYKSLRDAFNISSTEPKSQRSEIRPSPSLKIWAAGKQNCRPISLRGAKQI